MVYPQAHGKGPDRDVVFTPNTVNKACCRAAVRKVGPASAESRRNRAPQVRFPRRIARIFTIYFSGLMFDCKKNTDSR